jgi:hypothetical protein
VEAFQGSSEGSVESVDDRDGSEIRAMLGVFLTQTSWHDVPGTSAWRMLISKRQDLRAWQQRGSSRKKPGNVEVTRTTGCRWMTAVAALCKQTGVKLDPLGTNPPGDGRT